MVPLVFDGLKPMELGARPDIGGRLPAPMVREKLLVLAWREVPGRVVGGREDVAVAGW